MTRARRGLLLVLPLVCLAFASAAAAAVAPNDPKYPSQWGMQDIDAVDAWTLSTGAGVTVAVVDTGVKADHEDLAGHVLAGGWGFDGSTSDGAGHGTEVAGIIAATRGNAKGIAGVAPDASILPFRAFAGSEAPDASRIVEALDRAGDSGARVVNASFSTEPLAAREASTTAHAIEAVLAEHPATLYVTAAGNDNNDNDETPVYPCNADAPNLICVGSYTDSDQRAYDSNYGATSVDLFAPGAGIISTWPFGSGYHFDSGTSMAAPFVSGEAALLFAKAPRLTPEEAIGLILSTSDRVAAFAAKSASGGRPDAYAALQAASVDRDGDGVYDVVDNCADQPHATVDGCPAPPPPPRATPTPTATATPPPNPVPRLRSLTAKVARCKAGRTCRRSATVKLTPDRAAHVSLRVDRKVCRSGRCRWSRVLTKAWSVGTRGASVTVRGKHGASLAKGSYRVVAVLSSSAGTGKPATRTFRVR